MSTAVIDLLTQLELDLSSARLELARARLRRRQKDTPDHRLAVAASLERIDVLLDMHLEVAPRRSCGAHA